MSVSQYEASAHEFPENDYGQSDTGPYLTLEEFYGGVDSGVFGPDEDCRWVCINVMGHLEEIPITSIYAQPPDAIAVAYYPQ